MVSIVEFLRARLDEDEAAAHQAFSNQMDPENGWGSDGRAVTPHVGVIHEDVQRAHVVRWNPAVVLAEIAAKRALLALHADGSGHECIDGYYDHATIDVLAGACPTTCILASVYSDHPDYRSEWKP